MSTGKSAAKRESRQQRKMIAQQQRETQKELAEEKDIEGRMRRGLKASQEGRDGLLSQQLGLRSLLGIGAQNQGSGGGSMGGNVVTGGAGYFIDPTRAGTSLLPTAKAATTTVFDRYGRESTRKTPTKRTGRSAS